MWAWLLSKFDMTEPSDYEDFYEGLSWKTFRVDESIWNDNPRKRPKIGYYRALQHCYEQLLEELSDSFLYDVTELKNKFNEIHLKNCDLEKQLAIAQGTVQVLQYRLDSAMKNQTAQGAKKELYESQGMELKVQPEPKKEGARFSSNSGASLQENQMLAVAYFENNWSLQEIAEALKVAENTVKVYVSNMRKHYAVRFLQGRKMLCFDSDYGEVQWDLALYDKLCNKFPDMAENAS